MAPTPFPAVPIAFMFPKIERCQWVGHFVKMIGLRNWYQRGALWQGLLAKFYSLSPSESWGLNLREMQHDWPGGFRYRFIWKAFESPCTLHRSYIGHTQHIEIDTPNASPCFSCPVIHHHNEQSSGVPCLFHLGNPIVVKWKLHKQEDIQRFHKFSSVGKKPKWVFQCRHVVETLNLCVRPQMQEFQQLLFLSHVGHNNITIYILSLLS